MQFGSVARVGLFVLLVTLVSGPSPRLAVVSTDWFSTEVPASQIVIPPPASLFDTLRPGHPRLLVTADTLQPLRDRVASDPASAAMYQQTRVRATALLARRRSMRCGTGRAACHLSSCRLIVSSRG